MKSLIVVPFFLISLYLGNRLFNRLNVNSFKNVLMIMLLLSGISMLFR